MAPLPSNLRRDLERNIVRAREIAERGSREAIEALTVHEGKRGAHVTSDADIVLRNRLRARAQQIGDRRNSQSKAQAIDQLVQECAYEHWHRRIFARFLAENSLLVEPDSQVAVSLDDVEELARDEGIDRWELAGQYAQQSLPAIFRPDDPLLQVQLPREIRLQLDGLLDDLPRETFLADDSLGWVYQFWQSAEKERVNNLGDKITGETLSAVTQLFTEHYMVLFLLHNTLGAWYAGKVLAQRPDLAASAKSENELREALRLTEAGGYEFEYLRFVRDDVERNLFRSGTEDSDVQDNSEAGERNKFRSTNWRPMGGTFDGWPKRAAELKVLDPCCGSGHFLVAAFELLVRLRMLEEGLSVEAAVDAVIQDNLFGLELDPRCTQIAAFNVAVAAWKLTGPRPLPAMQNIACTGLSVGVPRDQWMKALESDGVTNLKFYFGQLYDMFSNASTLGSLINPNRFLGSHTLNKEEMDRLFAALESVIAADPTTSPEQHELGVAAQGLARAAELLASKYHVVLTNVPYLGRGKQDDVLKDHIETYYERGKADLAAAFVIRCLEFCDVDGTSSLVSPQNWLFLTTYKSLRESLLDSRSWNIVTRLGPGAFETITGHVVNVALLVITASTPEPMQSMGMIDAVDEVQPQGKSERLRSCSLDDIRVVTQGVQRKNPDAVIKFEGFHTGKLLGAYASCFAGILNGDSPKFRRFFWEFDRKPHEWVYQQSTVRSTIPYGGRTGLIFYDEAGGHLREDADIRRERLHDSDRRGNAAWGKLGVGISQMHDLPATLYTGNKFDSSIAVIFPKDQSLVPAIWAFCTDEDFRRRVRQVNQKVSVENGYFEKLPFDLARWQSVASQQYPHGLPEPESNDATQWLFSGRPDNSTLQTQVAIARLLGYRWPAELDSEMQLSDRARQLVESCEELLPYADEDGIVCIPAVRGEDTAATRLTRLLEACNLKPPHKLDDWLRNDFFKEHCELFQQRPFIWHIWDGRKADGFHALINYHKLVGRSSELVPNAMPSQRGAASSATTSEQVPSYQARWEQVPSYQARWEQGPSYQARSEQVPSYDAGHSGRKLLENLTYSYLGDWINRQESDVKRGESGADGRLAAAKTLQQQLIAILKGEPPYDIFVRWKPLHEQPIGWNPDINDGVRINIRPFMAVDIPGGRKGAGILRWGPKVKWTKDRGKEPKRPRDEYPWFWGWDEQTPNFPGTDTFTGDRWNDCHYTNAFKQAAQGK